MGLVYAQLQLLNATDIAMANHGLLESNKIRQTEVTALVDSGAYAMVINEEVCEKLGLAIVKRESGILADGSKIENGVAEPIEIRFANRDAVYAPVVMPKDSEVLLGAIPMRQMDVVVNMMNEELTVNPLYPDGPVRCLKGIR
jgi:clan AA aspartic protease